MGSAIDSSPHRRESPRSLASLGGPLLQHYLLAAFASLFVLLVHARTVSSALWTEGPPAELREAVFVIPAMLWLLWIRRDQLRTVPVRVWWPGLILVAAAAAFWLLAERSSVAVLQQFGLVFMLQGVVVTLLGLSVARAMRLPLLFPLLGVDVFTIVLTDPMMGWTATLSAPLLRVTGVAVALEGRTLILPCCHWQVVEACSGVTYLQVYAMASTFFAALAFRPGVRRALFILASPVAALLANVLRVWAIVWISSRYGGGHDPDHAVVGWISFSIVFLLLLGAGRRFQQPPADLIHPAAPPPSGALGAKALAALLAALIAALPVAAPAGVGAGLDGCRPSPRGTGPLGTSDDDFTRTECAGPAGRKLLFRLPSDLLGPAADRETLVTGTRRVERPGAAGPIDAATLTSLGTTVRLRLTYWYEFGDLATGQWSRVKWRLALALVAKPDTAVRLVSRLEALPEER